MSKEEFLLLTSNLEKAVNSQDEKSTIEFASEIAFVFINAMQRQAEAAERQASALENIATGIENLVILQQRMLQQ